jgi:hypothetical protein
MAIPMLLKNYKNAQGEPLLSEETAVLYVGSLACKMVEEGRQWLSSSEIKAMLQRDQVAIDAVLRQIPEASGIFVERTENKFGFSYRTYQEYFAARYLLWKIVTESDSSSQLSAIKDLVDHTCRVSPDDAWREPFILAVAFQSYEEDSEIANRIIQKLLTVSSAKSLADQVKGVCLAVSAQMEINPASVRVAVIDEIAETLIAVYERAFGQSRFDLCERIGAMMCIWLNHLAYSSDYTEVLHKALYKHTAITLLPMLLEGSAEYLEKLHQLQVASQTGSLTTSKLDSNYPGPLRFTQMREEEDDHTESPAKPTTEEDLVCAR